MTTCPDCKSLLINGSCTYLRCPRPWLDRWFGMESEVRYLARLFEADDQREYLYGSFYKLNVRLAEVVNNARSSITGKETITLDEETRVRGPLESNFSAWCRRRVEGQQRIRSIEHDRFMSAVRDLPTNQVVGVTIVETAADDPPLRIDIETADGRRIILPCYEGDVTESK